MIDFCDCTSPASMLLTICSSNLLYALNIIPKSLVVLIYSSCVLTSYGVNGLLKDVARLLEVALDDVVVGQRDPQVALRFSHTRIDTTSSV